MGFLYTWLHNGQQCWGEVVLTKRELHNVVDRYAEETLWQDHRASTKVV